MILTGRLFVAWNVTEPMRRRFETGLTLCNRIDGQVFLPTLPARNASLLNIHCTKSQQHEKRVSLSRWCALFYLDWVVLEFRRSHCLHWEARESFMVQWSNMVG